MALANNHELDWLPPGWKVEENVKNGRKVRCFINVKSSQRLYSKASVLRQIRKSRTNNQRSHSQLSNGPMTRSLRNKEIPIPTDKMPTEKIPTEPLTRSLRNKEILIPTDKMPTEPNDCHDSLPPGWITEVKTRKGGVRAGEDYKTYTELSTGKMFYSKPEVTRYLKGKEQSTGSSERKKSGATVDSSAKGSVRILRRHKPDQGEEVNPHPKFDEGKREEVPQHPKFDGSVRILRRHKPGQGEEVTPHPKSDEGKREEVPQHPKLDEQKTEEVPQDQNLDEGKREMGPQHPKHDKRKKEEVPQHPKFDEGKAKEVSQHLTVDKRKEEEVPQHPKFDEEPWQIVIASACVRKKEKWPQHPKLDKRKKEEVPQHAKLDKRKKEETPQHPKFDDGKKEVPQDPKFDEGKNQLEVPKDPKFDEGKTQPEVLQDPKFDEGKTQPEVPQDPKFDEGKNQPSKKRKVIVETVIAEGLPPGWIKEIRIKESSNGLRKDPFYTNPTSGYVFRSKLEVLRYLETGEISRHAYKRRGSGINTIQSTQESPSDSTVTSNTTEDSIKRQLFTGKKNPKRSSFSNCGYSKAGNNALLDLGADVDSILIETQMPKGNETDVVCIDTDPTSSSKDIFLEKKREDSNKAIITLPVETKSAALLSENEFPVVERSKDKEETGKRSSKSTEREPKRNGKEIDSSRRSSKRLAGIEIEHVTHSLPIERILRSANKRFDKSEAEQSQKAPPVTNVGSQEETVCHYNSESAIEFFQEEQSKDKEECGKKSSERKPKRNRKKTFEGIEVEPETHSLPSRRVLRSAIRASTKTEAVPSSGSNQGEQAQEVPQVINVGSQEEIVRHYAEPATVPSKNEFLGAEQIKDKEEYAKNSSGRKPKRSRKQIVSPHRSSKLLAGIEGESVTHSMAKQRVLQSARTEAMPSSGSEQGEQARETPLGVNLQEEIVLAASIFPEEQTTKASSRSNNTHQSVMIDFSRNTIGGQTTVEPSRNSFADQMFKEPPKINSKERFSTDELTNGRGKEQQDSPFSFPWSDPCIEFAYKTLTGALPLDDTLAIQDYVQHQIRTCSNSSNNFTLQDSRPPGFSLNTVPSNSSNSITFPDPGPPGFSRGSAPSKRNDNFALPEARPPGFPRNTASNSGNNPTLPDATPPGFSFNTAPSNRGNNLTLTDAMPPGFSLNDAPSDCSNNTAFPDAMPPGFSLNDLPSSCGNNIAFADATPPGFSLNDAPYHGNNIAFPDSTPPGFFLNDVPSTRGYNITFPDSGPPGFSRGSVPSNNSNNPAIPDGTPPGFTRSSIPSNRNDKFALPEARAPGFSQSSVLSNRSNNFAIPDARSPGFSRSSVPSNSDDHFALPDPRPPGFSLNSVPSNSNNDHFSLPDARPLGFSLNGVPSNSNNDHFSLPDARPPGFSLNSVPSNCNNDHFALPDARPPGFSRSSVPPNSNNDHFAIPYARPPGFSQSSAPSNCNYDHFAIPDAKPPGFSRSSVPSNSNNDNFALPDARRTGFPWSSSEPSNSPWSSSEPSNSGNNPAHPDGNPPGFSWSGFPLDNGINLNVAFTDEGPPGFSEKIVPSSKQQQQDINPAGSRTQATDFPLQGTFFSSWNRN